MLLLQFVGMNLITKCFHGIAINAKRELNLFSRKKEVAKIRTSNGFIKLYLYRLFVNFEM